MSELLVEKLTKTREGMRLYQQERAIQEVTDVICELLVEQGVSRSDLARRLGKTKGYVTQLLDGQANMTIRTICDVFSALDRAVHFQEGPLSVTAKLGSVLPLCPDATWRQQDEAWSGSVALNEQAQLADERLAG